jgi:hypothetical protein
LPLVARPFRSITLDIDTVTKSAEPAGAGRISSLTGCGRHRWCPPIRRTPALSS